MPPLRDYRCLECGNCVEYLIRSDADVPSHCEACGSPQIDVVIAAHAGYAMDSGPSSIRPRRAGSFKTKEK